MPMVGLGTWQYNDSVVADALTKALHLGYPHVDTAYDYKNAAGIKTAIAKSGRPRSKLFITTKVEGGLSFENTTREAEQNLKSLGVEYVDLLLLHFPAPITPKGFIPGTKKMRQEQWRAMEQLHKQGMFDFLGDSIAQLTRAFSQ